MQQQIAKIALAHIKASVKDLEDSLVVVRDNCAPEESTAYVRGVAQILSEIQDRILDPIIREHPSLVPEDVDYAPRPGPTLAQMGAKSRDEGPRAV